MKSLTQQWEELKKENPHIRIRNAAQKLGVTEVELLATRVGEGVVRLENKAVEIFKSIASLGRVMVLTRNEECVHEEKGLFQEVEVMDNNQLRVNNENINLRIDLNSISKVFGVTDHSAHGTQQSIQFFDKSGEAIHKIYLTADSNQQTYDAILEQYRSSDQLSQEAVSEVNKLIKDEKPDVEVDLEGFHSAWKSLESACHFGKLIESFGLTRIQALRLAPSDYYADKIDNNSIVKMLEEVAKAKVPVVISVSNAYVYQTFKGIIRKTMWHQTWYNIMDPDFNLHLDMSKIAATYVVRKPSNSGTVTSIEAYNEMGELIVHFFSPNAELDTEQSAWREIVGKL
ncbi:MAG: ChuX/HutX family heme-like substrate-binding protein [Bacteroidota bacterium]|nr:ChuX/HutX family heme-like substrate-binding protein [Bacteroidota bacterium]